MQPFLTYLTALSRLEEPTAAGSPVRTAVRVLLGVFITLLLLYVVIEQIGTWRRRRSHREH
jgi:hypothetical protein